MQLAEDLYLTAKSVDHAPKKNDPPFNPPKICFYVLLSAVVKKCKCSIFQPYAFYCSYVQGYFAEREGFEPPDLLQSTVFKTAAIDHSATSPLQK